MRGTAKDSERQSGMEGDGEGSEGWRGVVRDEEGS